VLLTVIAVAGLFGLIIGSFLNVVVWRVPRGESVVSPGSACPGCGSPIRPADNVPVLSWLLLRDRARCCGMRIAVRYPLVELATGLAFGAVAGWLVGRPRGALVGPWALPAFGYLAAITIALTLVDLDLHRLPNAIVLPSYPVAAVLLALPSAVAQDWRSLARAAIGAAALWAFYFGLMLIYPAGMGYGDVKLAGLLGMYLGWLGWSDLVVGAAAGFGLGGVLSTLLLAVRLVTRKSMIPFGPFMLAGAWLAVAVAQPVTTWYLHTAGL
jgi:leader peptidase (prepilin peptidase) / N-methyltransferase